MRILAICVTATSMTALSAVEARAATLEYTCTVRQAFLQERGGQLAPKAVFIGNVFSASRETGRISAASVGPYFASPSAKPQILFGGGSGEPFAVISVNRTAQGGVNVEFLAVRDFPEFSAKTFLAYGVGGMIFTGTCE